MKSALLTACFGFWALIAQAGNGTWTNLNGGSWTNAANWSGGTIADASGSTANFSTLNLPADATVTLDTARTIGNLTFDDQNSTKHNWFLNAGGAGALTLAGTTPTITVSSATTTIALPLAGTASLTKLGSGALVFAVTNALILSACSPTARAT